MRAALVVLACTVIVIVNAAPDDAHTVSLEYPSPLVREERTVIVDGSAETWRLQWASEPKPSCEPSDVSLTCPCTGFAYGEEGDLILVRLRGDIELERMRLAPFFGETFGAGETAIVQRWPVDRDKDFNNSGKDDFADIVSKRPAVPLMQFADYDHDGGGTEFYLQTEALPCGKSYGIVVGVSKSDPRLHVFGPASHPAKPLYLQKHVWETLRDASSAVDVVAWPCGDHGAENETRLHLYWTRDGVDGVSREYSCPPDGTHVLSEEPLWNSKW